MANKLSDSAQAAACDAIMDLINLGSTNAEGTLRFYTGAQNANGNSEATGAICDCELSNPATGAADANGLATFSTIAQGVATASGTVQSFAVLNRDGNVVFTGTVTATGGGGDIELTSVNISHHDVIVPSSLTYQVPQDQS